MFQVGLWEVDPGEENLDPDDDSGNWDDRMGLDILQDESSSRINVDSLCNVR